MSLSFSLPRWGYSLSLTGLVSLAAFACKEATPITVQGVALAPEAQANLVHVPPARPAAASPDPTAVTVNTRESATASALSWPSAAELSRTARLNQPTQGDALPEAPSAPPSERSADGAQDDASAGTTEAASPSTDTSLAEAPAQEGAEAGGAAYQARANYPGSGGGQPRRPLGQGNRRTPSSQPHGRAPASQPRGQAPGGASHGGGGAPQQQAGGSIRGIIQLDPSLQGRVPAGAVLFIIVRRDAGEGQRGTLIAATKADRISAASFPFPFVVTQRDAMMGAPLLGSVRVCARIDADGDALSRDPGDLVGEASAAVEVNGEPVRFSITRGL